MRSRTHNTHFHYNIKHAQKESHQGMQWWEQQIKNATVVPNTHTHTHTHTLSDYHTHPTQKRRRKKAMLDESVADGERRQWLTMVADRELWEMQEAGRQAGKSGGCWHS